MRHDATTSAPHEPSVRESITRRLLLGIEKLKALVDAGELSEAAGLRALELLVETTLPFVLPELVNVVSDIVVAWKLNCQANADKTKVIAKINTQDTTDESEAW